MLIGALLTAIWLVLLLRYPSRAVPINLLALLALGLVALGVIWQEQREEERLARLELQLAWDTNCPPDRPIRARLQNGSDRPLTELTWRVAAYQTGNNIDLADDRYDSPEYRTLHSLLPGSEWSDCQPLPPLRSGYRASSLEYRAERLRGRFAD